MDNSSRWLDDSIPFKLEIFTSLIRSFSEFNFGRCSIDTKESSLDKVDSSKSLFSLFILISAILSFSFSRPSKLFNESQSDIDIISNEDNFLNGSNVLTDVLFKFNIFNLEQFINELMSSSSSFSSKLSCNNSLQLFKEWILLIPKFIIIKFSNFGAFKPSIDDMTTFFSLQLGLWSSIHDLSIWIVKLFKFLNSPNRLKSLIFNSFWFIIDIVRCSKASNPLIIGISWTVKSIFLIAFLIS